MTDDGSEAMNACKDTKTYTEHEDDGSNESKLNAASDFSFFHHFPVSYLARPISLATLFTVQAAITIVRPTTNHQTNEFCRLSTTSQKKVLADTFACLMNGLRQRIQTFSSKVPG